MMYQRIIYSFLLSALITLSASSQAPSSSSVMAIFSHPDDEMTVAPILAKLAENGTEVHLVIATDGRLGTNDFTDHEAGEGLVALRIEEMKCAAEKLGVNLIHLDYHDQLRADEGYDGHVPHARKLVLELEELITKYRPDAIITWGPDGGTTHMDHRLVGASVTQVFVSKKWEKAMKLFYYATPSDELSSDEQRTLRGVERSLLNVELSYDVSHAEKALESLRCHTSQISPEFFSSREQGYKEGPKIIYFREFVAPNKKRTSIFH